MAVHPVRPPTLLPLAVLAGLILFVPDLSADSPAAKGDLWETTSQMSMNGMPMPMPLQKQTRCTAKEWSAPPGGGDQGEECVTSDFTQSGNQVTWTSQCANGMSGHGEITMDNGTYTGEIRYTSDEGEVVMKLTGRRIGECDNPR